MPPGLLRWTQILILTLLAYYRFRLLQTCCSELPCQLLRSLLWDLQSCTAQPSYDGQNMNICPDRWLSSLTDEVYTSLYDSMMMISQSDPFPQWERSSWSCGIYSFVNNKRSLRERHVSVFIQQRTSVKSQTGVLCLWLKDGRWMHLHVEGVINLFTCQLILSWENLSRPAKGAAYNLISKRDGGSERPLADREARDLH